MPIPCFLLEPTVYAGRWLRRYAPGRAGAQPPPCPVHGYMHDEMALLSRRVKIRELAGGRYRITEIRRPHPTDPRWPTTCACGYRFQARDEWQVFSERLYMRADTAELLPLRAAPAGAMWWAPWMADVYPGPDGRCLVVKTPGGDWVVDGMASNCARKDDWALPVGDPGRHWCWVRHGEPPAVTVDKKGRTCGAGSGSIAAGRYHGFLRDGVLT